jgi:proteasome lid subunit RPN8/RPN11
MFSKVRVRKSALDHFRRLAREAAPFEIEAFFTGRIISVDEVEILNFHYAKNYKIQTNNLVQWSSEDMDALKKKAEDNNLRIIGSIHSHPNWDAVMSPADYRAYITDQLIICGICSVYNRKTRVRFWTPTSALPCKIIYS